MTYLDAAYAILQAAGEALHYEEITQRALDQSLIAPQGLTPAATMGSRLYTDTKQEASRFVRAGRGQFGLTQWQPKGIEARAQEINQATRTRLAELLQRMAADRFESLVGEVWEGEGEGGYQWAVVLDTRLLIDVGDSSG